MPTTMTLEVRRADERSRYELVADGELIGVCDFAERGSLVLFPHTEIAYDRRGQGYGEALVRGALEDVRSRGQKVVPGCWFVAEYFEVHPEEADLLA
ncbi:MAG TPA: GNAT family N-acetyltransferase [Acidimicrobiales bacterium]|nr:GNAT family N-acetyltransferase [Acidimicrobiales bacterium]